MTIQEFAASIAAFTADTKTMRLASMRTLKLFEGLLALLLGQVREEIDARGRRAPQLTIVRRCHDSRHDSHQWIAIRGDWWGFGDSRGEAIAKMNMESRV